MSDWRTEGPDDWASGVMALPAPEGCKLWLLDLRTPIDEAQWRTCSEEEHARASRFRFERDAVRYRAAHALMRQVLARQLGTRPEAVHWRRGTHGKPHLIGHPGWHFNLGHSGEWGIVGLSQGERIGVDIECHQPRIDVSDIASQSFTASERTTLASTPPDERATFFYRTWVAKEAALKALGCGLILAPSEIAAPWQAAWSVASARWEGLSLAPRVHGLRLPNDLGGQVEAAVALWQPDPAAGPSASRENIHGW